MALARLQAFGILILLSLIGFGPISLTALIALYVIWMRPRRVLHWVQRVYGHPTLKPKRAIKKSALQSQIQGTIILLVLFTLDLLPVPVTGSIALLICSLRPAWFIHWLASVYQRGSPHRG